MNKKICAILADGIEEMELIVPVDIFRRSGIDVVLSSVEKHLEIYSAHGVKITADINVEQVDVSQFDALMIPGGALKLAKDAALIDLVKSFHQAGKLICAICAAPSVLGAADILKDKNFCCHPCVYGMLPGADKNARVVIDDDLITAKGPGAAAEFGLAIVGYLCGQEAAEAVEAEMFL